MSTLPHLLQRTHTPSLQIPLPGRLRAIEAAVSRSLSAEQKETRRAVAPEPGIAFALVAGFVRQDADCTNRWSTASSLADVAYIRVARHRGVAISFERVRRALRSAISVQTGGLGIAAGSRRQHSVSRLRHNAILCPFSVVNAPAEAMCRLTALSQHRLSVTPPPARPFRLLRRRRNCLNR